MFTAITTERIALTGILSIQIRKYRILNRKVGLPTLQIDFSFDRFALYALSVNLIDWQDRMSGIYEGQDLYLKGDTSFGTRLSSITDTVNGHTTRL